MSRTEKKLLFRLKLAAEFLWVCVCVIPVVIVAIFRKVIPRKGKDIRGKVALVTGAAQGLGRELSLELSRLGCTVICVDVNEEGNRNTAQEIVTLGRKATAHSCDISDSKAVSQLAANVGQVDILVNNAGIVYFDSLMDIPEAIINKVLDVNVKSQFLMLQAFLPGMIERDSGHIVATASCEVLVGLANASLYCASKFAVVGFMNTVEEEMRLQGLTNIKFTCVCPYFIRTLDVIDTRIVCRIPPYEADIAAREIVRGIRQDLSLFTVPRYMETSIYLQRLMPKSIQDKFRDVIHATATARHPSEDANNLSKKVKE